jgi:DNA-binding transcriptional MerR regulator
MAGYTLKQVAGQVGVSTATIIRWMATKKVRVARKKNQHGYYSFTEADLRKLIDYKNRSDSQ